MIITANHYFRTSWEAYEMAAINPGLARQGLPLLKTVDEDNPIVAYINHGRWIAKCECGGAEYVWEEELFMCQSCWNASHKHQNRHTTFPKERKAIETILEVRPLPNRNWLPNETMALLIAENEEHQAELVEVR